MHPLFPRALRYALMTSPLIACFPPPIAPDEVPAGDAGTAEVGADATSTEDGVADDDLASGPDAGEAEVVEDPAGATGLAATATDDGVRLDWVAGPAATRQVLERCPGVCDEDGPWTPIPLEEGATSYLDGEAEPAPAPPAPTGLTASSDDPEVVTVRWDDLTPPPAPSVSYRVASEGPDGALPTSPIVVGARPTPAISGWGWSRDGGDSWARLEADTRSLVIDDAPGPWVEAVASASEGTVADAVELQLTRLKVEPGAALTVLLRAETAVAAGANGSVTGARAAPSTVFVRWQRSEDGYDETFADLGEVQQGGPGDTFAWRDTGAPADGGVRSYRATVSGAGLTPLSTEAVTGWRTPPLGVPENVQASNDLPDRVRVSWEAVPGAAQYAVYRDGALAATVSALSWDDLDTTSPAGSWVAPGTPAVTAVQGGLQLSWVAPVRPVGPLRSYKVRAAGSDKESAAATGRTSAPALVGWEIEATHAGVVRTIPHDTLEATWTDTNAPTAVISYDQLSATPGTRRKGVALTAVATVTQPKATSYRVRGRLAGTTPSWTPHSAAVSGARTSGTTRYAWYRSPTDSALSDFEVIAEGEGVLAPAFDDTTAPADGSRRHYRLSVSADDVPATASSTLVGWRLAFAEVAAGGNHACAITTDGALWCWGARNRGQLGTGVQPSGLPTPVQVVPASDPVVSVATGWEHTCFIKRTGALLCMGSNDNGEAAVAGTLTVPTPTAVQGISSPVSVVAGRNLSCAAQTGGQARCWGAGGAGQLGNGGQPSAQASPVLVMAAVGQALGNVRQLAASAGTHTCAIAPDKVSCWGRGDYGQLGLGTASTSSMFAAGVQGLPSTTSLVSTGGAHTCAVDTGSVIRCWGFNDAGQCGPGGGQTKVWNPTQQPLPGGQAVAAISAGTNHTCAVTSDRSGRLLFCWGDNAEGELGYRTTNTYSNAATQLGNLSGVRSVAAGHNFTCAVVQGGLMCWGASGAGQAGAASGQLATPTALQLP